MSGKISFDNNDSDFEYQPTDSEDDYSEEEKELLKDIRKNNQRDVEPTRELLRFDESDEEEADDDNDDADDHKDDDDDDDDDTDEDEMMEDSDIEGADDDGDDIPDSKAWGKKAHNYYNTDFVDPDFSAYNEKELELAQMEEEEARAIQQRLAQEMKETDFKFDLVTTTDDPDKADRRSHDEDKNGHLITLKTDLRGLSQREKMQLFLKDSPEFPGLKTDLMSALNEINELLNPVLEYAQVHRLPHVPLFQFAHTLRQLLSTYCLNINFYLILKVNRTPVKYHPVTRRLVELKRMRERLNDRYENVVKPQLHALAKRIKDGEHIEILLEAPAQKKALKKDTNDGNKHPKKGKRVMFNLNNVDDGEKYISENDEQLDEEEAAMAEEEEAGEEGAYDGDERRGITYQIAKNKGLTPYRKKEQRNPRVKHRNKFRKALIRRKGAVRTVRKELTRYAGEMSGIKATVVKSIKFK